MRHCVSPPQVVLEVLQYSVLPCLSSTRVHAPRGAPAPRTRSLACAGEVPREACSPGVSAQLLAFLEDVMLFRKGEDAGPPEPAAQSRAGMDHRYLPPTAISRAWDEGRLARAPRRVLVIRIALRDPTCRGNAVIEFWREARILTGA